MAGLAASHQHANQQANAKRHTNGFIGVLANCFVSDLGAGNGSLFQPSAGFLGGIQCLGQTLAQFDHLLAGLSGGRVHQSFGVVCQNFQIRHQFLHVGFFCHNTSFRFRGLIRWSVCPAGLPPIALVYFTEANLAGITLRGTFFLAVSDLAYQANSGDYPHMTDLIRRQLVSLFGPVTGTAAAAQLKELIASYRTRMTRRTAHATGPFSEADVMLITYADQVREPDRKPLQTLADFATQHLRDTVSAIHLLPFYPWSSDDGFSVKDFFSVDPAFGTWEDIDRLRPHFALMFDAVLNHMSAQGEWFQQFLADDPRRRDFFVTVEGTPDLSQVVRPRALPLLTEFPAATGPKKIWTTFSADQVDLNFKNPAVLLAALDALLFYVQRGAKFIRLDAIAYLWKEMGTSCIHLPQTHLIIQLMRAVLDEVAPHVLLITETNVPHRDNISYFGNGTNEAQLVYNFSLPPLTLHSLQTGDATALTRWAQSLGLPGDRTTWFNFLASHDGIGVNPVRGILSDAQIAAMIERVQAHGGLVSYKSNPNGSESPYELNINYLDALSNPTGSESIELAARKFLTAQAIMLSLQGVPGIYFHSLFGSRGDLAGVEATGIKRRINRQKLARFELERELNDPSSLRARVFGDYRELLRVRRSEPAFHPNAPQQVLALDPRLFAVLREAKNQAQRYLCLHNVSGFEVPCSLVQVPELCDATTVELTLQPYATTWLAI